VTASEWISIAVGIAALASPVVIFGMMRQKVIDLDAKIGNLATKESVESLGGRVDDLEAEVKDVPKIVTAVEVLKAEFKGFRDLVSRDTDELKHGNRNIRTSLDAISRTLTDHRPNT
jgi:hypothetical protein